MRSYVYLKRLAATALIASAAAVALPVAGAQAGCVGIYCEGPTGPIIQQAQALASEALTLAPSISNATDKAKIESVIAQSSAAVAQSNALLLQAQNTKDPVAKAKLRAAAVLAAASARALANLAVTCAKATLHAEGKKPAADAARARAAARPSPQAVQRQVTIWLTQARAYAKRASTLLNQAARLLRGRPSKRNQQRASSLISQARKDVAKAQVLSVKAKALFARTK